MRHPVAGRIALEYSAFAVDGRPDLSMVIYNPATPADADKVRSLVRPQTSARTRTAIANGGNGKTRGRVRRVAQRNVQRGRRG